MEKLIHRKRQKSKQVVAKRLKKAREGKGLTTQELSSLSSVRDLTIKRIEAGIHLGTIESAIKLAMALETTVEELFYVDTTKGRGEQ